jgi:hypothetical protein
MSRSQVAVTGSVRGLELQHWTWFVKMMDRITFGLVDPVILTYGHSSKRVDAFAHRWSSMNWLVQRVFYLDETIHGTDRERNELIVGEADYLIAFTDGHCPLTERMLDDARESKVKVKVFKL